MVNVKKRKGRVVIDSDSEDSASDDNLDQVRSRSIFQHDRSYIGLNVNKGALSVQKKNPAPRACLIGLYWSS